ncbi:hypothetical protein [Nostoc sp. MG11]|uniref:hypothetical protein n=1 Tax=Nostoc sp. MG11 TaxID=2721166 RepID=UPI0029FF2873|nr:hypothetical protein [Nostoc sp. MG11]
MLVEEIEKILHTELVKYGVKYEKAGKVARILASRQPDELLTQEEIQLSKEVCQQWLKQRQRMAVIEEAIDGEGIRSKSWQNKYNVTLELKDFLSLLLCDPKTPIFSYSISSILRA